MTPENAAELMAACSHQSCEQVEAILAARFPKSDVRDSIRRLPVRVEALSPARFGVHFTADSEFRELLEEVKALASHSDGGTELLNVMKRGLLAYRRELHNERFGWGASLGSEPRSACFVKRPARLRNWAVHPENPQIMAQ